MSGSNNLKAWAEKYDFIQELDILVKNGFDTLYSVATITDSDLEKIGITKIGTRKKILAAVGRVNRKIQMLLHNGGSLADINKLAYAETNKNSSATTNSSTTPSPSPSTNTTATTTATVTVTNIDVNNSASVQISTFLNNGQALPEKTELALCIEIRKATLADIPQLTEIYNWYVKNEPEVCGTEIEIGEKAMVDEFYEQDDRHYILVEALIKPFEKYTVGTVLGFLKMQRFYHTHSGVQNILSMSMFMHHEFKSRKIGYFLSLTCGALCYKHKFTSVINIVAECNKKSLGFADKLGFRRAGALEKIQLIRGVPYDLVYYQKDFANPEQELPIITSVLTPIKENIKFDIF